MVNARVQVRIVLPPLRKRPKSVLCPATSGAFALLWKEPIINEVRGVASPSQSQSAFTNGVGKTISVDTFNGRASQGRDLDTLLREMVALGASDLHLKAAVPPIVRV